MELYRKYFNGEMLDQLAGVEPNWGISILNAGHNVHKGSCSYPDQHHPNEYRFDWENGRVLKEFQLVYISKGRGIFETKTTPPTVIEGGTAFLLFPDVWHRYRPEGEIGWEEFWVGFEGHYPEYLMRQDCFDADRPIIKIGFDAELMNVFLRLIDTLKFEGIAYKQISSCLVIQLLALIYASVLMTESQPSAKEKAVNHFRFMIHQKWDQTLNMEDLAASQGMGYVWLRKAFKEITGISPGQYHLNFKLEKACRMLRETSLSISQVAFRTGFDSEFYFSRLFKKKLQMSPKSYRQQSE